MGGTRHASTKNFKKGYFSLVKDNTRYRHVLSYYTAITRQLLIVFPLMPYCYK